MKYLKVLFITLIGIFFSHCSNNIDEILITEVESGWQKCLINDNFLANEKLSENEILFVAKKFASNNLFSTLNKNIRSAPNLDIDNFFPLLSEEGQTLAYVVNFKGGGYNIVSATQKYAPIIGFSEKGSIQKDYEDRNPSFAFWLNFLKEDILYQINKKNDSDSIAIKNRLQWRAYESAALTNSSSLVSTDKDHRYWYNQERYKTMEGQTTGYRMSEDLQKFREIMRSDYENGPKLSTSEMEHLIKTNTAMESEYSRAGLWQPSAYFWTEYYNEQKIYDKKNLIETRWQQGYPYNILNPLKNEIVDNLEKDKHQPIGCVTIAVSQILNFHKHPQILERLQAMSIKTLNVNWSKTNIASLNDTTLLDIPQLLRFVNQGVFTKNGDNGSSSNITNAKDFFDINEYLTYQYDGARVDKMIEEVKAGRPVYVRGINSNNIGHAFICDGYKAVQQQLYIELIATNSPYVQNYSSNPYYKFKTARGSKITTDEYLGFNWGWGSSAWVIKPSNQPIDFSTFNNDIKLLTIQKR